MTITGSTRLAAVVGHPVRHSLSPVILNAAFAAGHLDWAYLALDVAGDRGGEIVAAARTLGLGGLSVTMPHKAAVAATVDRRTAAADALGAVNCVSWDDAGRALGDNTDGPGFLDALRLDEGIDPAGARCAVVGAGGAGRAVARALGLAGAAEVVVVNRSPGPAAVAAALAGPAGRVGGPADLATAEIVVNATPLGMGKPGSAGSGGRLAVPIDTDVLRSTHTVVDLIYHPERTPLLAEAEHRGARIVNGLGMLVHQAAHAFRRWTGHEPPVQTMFAAVRAELGRRSERHDLTNS